MVVRTVRSNALVAAYPADVSPEAALALVSYLEVPGGCVAALERSPA